MNPGIIDKEDEGDDGIDCTSDDDEQSSGDCSGDEESIGDSEFSVGHCTRSDSEDLPMPDATCSSNATISKPEVTVVTHDSVAPLCEWDENDRLLLCTFPSLFL